MVRDNCVLKTCFHTCDSGKVAVTAGASEGKRQKQRTALSAFGSPVYTEEKVLSPISSFDAGTLVAMLGWVILKRTSLPSVIHPASSIGALAPPIQSLKSAGDLPEQSHRLTCLI